MTKEQLEALKIFKGAIKGIETETDVIGCQFACVDNYENQHGEVSRQTINLGIPRELVLRKNLERYERLQKDAGRYALLVDKHGNETVIQAFMKLMQSARTCISGTNVYSAAQKDAYLVVTSGIKICIANGNIMLHGYPVSKVILVPGVYPEVKHRKLTLCQNDIKKSAGIIEPKNFILGIDNIGAVNIAKKKITFPMLKAA